MKRLLIAGAVGLVVAGCAPVEVQRKTLPQFEPESQMEFYKRLQARASSGDGQSATNPSEARHFDLSAPGRRDPSETGSVSTTDQDEIAAGNGPAVEAANGARSPGGDVTEETASQSGNDGASSEAVVAGDTAAPEADTVVSAEGSEGGAEAAPASQEGGKGKPKKENPSCENSGGHAATCG